MHPVDLDQQLLVSQRAGRGRAGLGGVVGARRDLRPGRGQRPADRLDAELVLMAVDVVDDQRCGRSSSADELSRGRPQDRVGTAQFAHFLLQLAHALGFAGRGAGTVAFIDLGLLDPIAQSLKD